MAEEEPPSGLAVPIAVPRTIADLRGRWDRAARAGAQPHVTVLYPFLPASRLTHTVREAMAEIAARVEPFEVTFRDVRRFDEGVIWLEPRPADSFHALTAAVVARWPDHPPYGGRFDVLIPHLTVVEAAEDGPPLAAIERTVARGLPFRARADRLELWRQDAAGRWHPHWSWRLGRDPSVGPGQP
jgi:2'-5' RNA ligase